MQPINVAQHYVDATNKTTPERDILAPVFIISSFYRVKRVRVLCP